jgi:hypothetical protein
MACQNLDTFTELVLPIPELGEYQMKPRRTREERQAIARRIFEALCKHYPDRYVALVEQPGSTEPTVLDATALSRGNAIAD